MSPLERFAGLVVDHPRKVVLATLVLAVPFVVLATRIEFANSLEIWFGPDDPQMIGYTEFQEEFGSDEFFLVAFATGDAFGLETLTLLADITEALEAIPAGDDPHGVRVLGLTSLSSLLPGRGPAAVLALGFDPDRVLEEGADAHRSGLARWAAGHPLVEGTLVSADGRTVALVGRVPKLPMAAKRQLTDDVRASLASFEDRAPEGEIHLAGMPILDADFDSRTQTDTARFLPIGFGAIVLVLAIVFRRPAPIVLCCLVVGISFSVAVGLFNHAGLLFNISTSILPPLILAITVADGVHIVTHYQEELGQGHDRRGALVLTVVRMASPCFFTSLTTAVGFASFLFMDVDPVRQVGTYTAIGIAAAFVVSMTFLPAALALVPVGWIGTRPARDTTADADPDAAPTDLTTRLLVRIARLNHRFRHVVLVGTLAICVASGFMIARIDAQTYGVEFFKPHDPIRRGYEFIESRLGGVSNFEYVVDGEPGAFRDPENLARLRAFEERFLAPEAAGDPDAVVTAVVSPAVLVGAVTDIVPSASTDDAIEIFGRMGEDDPLRHYLSGDASAARITVRLRTIGTAEGTARMRAMQADLEKRFGEGATVRVTGIVPMYVYMNQLLLRSQIRSLSIAFLVITVLMCFCLRSFALGMVSVVPNLIPVAMTLGVMGATGIPLDVATVMVAGAALGIAVDDTIHYMTRYRRELAASGGDPVVAMERCVRSVGRAMVFTSAILLGGFGALTFGSFNPTIALGGLTALTMVFALVGDLVILPVILLVFRPLRREVPRDSTPRDGDAPPE